MKHMSGLKVFVLLAGALIVGVASPAAGQGTTGQIGGSVVDQQGAAVPGASVSVRNADTQTVRDVVTSIDGTFVIANVIAGAYEIKVSLSGFKTYTQPGIRVSATERVSLAPIILQVGGMTEQVSVEASAIRVQTQSGERSSTITAEQLESIGLKGRDYLGMLQLLPGVEDTRNREAPGWEAANNLTINGMANFNLTYDGITNKDTGQNRANYASPALDSIAEVKVQSSNFQAEYGRSAGATITVITKSGSSRFSGSAAYFKRHEKFNENTFARKESCAAAEAAGGTSPNCLKARYRYDNSSFTFGGPVLIPGSEFNRNRDKLFFFYSLDVLPRTTPGGLQNSTMPTARERNGDFSQTRNSAGVLRYIRDPSIPNGTCAVGTGVGNACFPGNVIPESRFRGSVGWQFLNLLPLPNAIDPTGNQQYNYQYEPVRENDRLEHVTRIDWNPRPGTTFYTRNQFGKEINSRGFGATLGAQGGWPQLASSYDIDTFSTVNTLIHTFSANMVFEAIAGMNWSRQLVYPLTQADRDNNDYSKVLTAHQALFPDANPERWAPAASFGGSNALPNTPGFGYEGSNRFPFTASNPIINVAANLTHVRNSHNLKAGVFVERTARPSVQGALYQGSYNFGSEARNGFDTNFGYANALLGSLNSYTEADARPIAESRFNQIEFFVQDNWRVTRRITLDYGARWNYMGAQYLSGQQVPYFDPTEWDPARAPQLWQPACPNNAATCSSTQRIARNPVTGELRTNSIYIGKLVAGTGDPDNGMVLVDGTPPQLQNDQFKFGPRVGIAWDITGDGKTALRGGYGRTFDRYEGGVVSNLIQGPPHLETFTASWTNVDALQSSESIIGPRGVMAFTPHQSITVHSWSVSLQRELPLKLLADVAYVGNTERNVARNVPINGLMPAQLNTSNPANMDPTTNFQNRIGDDFRRPYPGYAGINERQYFKDGQTYHSLQVSVIRRMANGLSGSLSYTGSSRCGLDNWDYFRTEEENRARHTNCSGGRPHNLVMSYNYLVPDASRFLGNNIIAQGVLDGWQVSGVTNVRGGTRGTLTYRFIGAPAGDLTEGLGGSRVIYVCDPNLPRGERTRERQFRTECVAPPGPRTDPNDTFYQGTSLGDEWVSIGYVNHDITLFKNFRMTGRRNLQIRVELYNAFNTDQFTTIDTQADFDFATLQMTDTNFGRATGTRANSARVIQLGARFTF